jgi:hypothetical protein
MWQAAAAHANSETARLIGRILYRPGGYSLAAVNLVSTPARFSSASNPVLSTDFE